MEVKVLFLDSPVEQRRKELSKEFPAAQFNGSAYVFGQLQSAAHAMAKAPFVYLSDEHIECMAIMGTGNEQLMKDEMWRCRQRRWI